MGLKFTEIIGTRWSQGPAQKVEGDGECRVEEWGTGGWSGEDHTPSGQPVFMDQKRVEEDSMNTSLLGM